MKEIEDEFKSFIKLTGGSEANRCFYPLKLDTYGRGCNTNCTYCYARSVLHFRGLWNSENPATADFDKIEKLFTDVYEHGKKNKWSDFLLQKMPIRLGGMVDCFGKSERDFRVSLRTLQLLKKYQYPYQIFTKNALVAEPEYLEALDPTIANVQFTITTPYDDVSLQYEEGADVTSSRLKAMKILSDKGFYVAARINPLFPIYPDGWFSGKFKNSKFFDIEIKPFRYFDWSLVDKIAEYGGKTVIAGFLRLSTWNIRWIKEKTGEDLTYLFDPSTKHANTSLHFSSAEKKYYYEKIQQRSHELGMAFSVCYDGDDAYHEFQYLWENQNDCCNAKGNVLAFTHAYDFFNGKFGK